MAFAASLPNLFLGVTSALRGTPELSLGDVAGNNLVALTLAVALAVLLSRREIPAESKTVQTTSIFTFIAAILPLALTLDGTLSRIDGGILIGLFAFYFLWLMSKRERFTQVYGNGTAPRLDLWKTFALDSLKVVAGIALLLFAAYGIVSSAEYFALYFAVPLIFIGILVTGLGNALPETYFAVSLARKGETDMILGNLMGSVVVPATLVLGIVALIQPIVIADLTAFAIARFFMVAAALFFFFSIKIGKRITIREATGLLALYLAFVIFEIVAKFS